MKKYINISPLREKIVGLLIIVSVFALYYHYHTTTIYIIRHGEKVIAEGISDAPLTDNGKIQAKHLGIYLASKKKISHLYVSPMRRARQTAEIIALQTGSSISFDDRLTEKNYRRSTDLYPDGTYVYVKFLEDGTKETKEQHLARLLSFFKDRVHMMDKEMYIVAHGGLINRIFEKIESSTNQSIEKHKVGYCSMFSFEYNKITKTFKYLNHFDLGNEDDNK